MRGVWIALLASDGGDVDDPAEAALEHLGDCSAAGQVWSNQIDLDHAAPDVGCKLPQLPVPARDAGVVDQDVEASMLGDDGARRLVHSRLIGQVQGLGRDTSQLAELRGG